MLYSSSMVSESSYKKKMNSNQPHSRNSIMISSFTTKDGWWYMEPGPHFQWEQKKYITVLMIYTVHCFSKMKFLLIAALFGWEDPRTLVVLFDAGALTFAENGGSFVGSECPFSL